MSDPLVSNGPYSNNPDIPVRCSTTTASKEVQHLRQDNATSATTQSFTIPLNNSANVLPANPNRLSASIYLNTATTVNVRYGLAPDASTFKLQLRGSGSYFELPQPIYTGDVYVFAPTAPATVLAAEETGDYI